MKDEILKYQERIKELEKENLELSGNTNLNQEIISNANYGIIVYNTELRIQVWNPFMEKLTGFTAKEILGKHPADIFPFLVENKVIDKLYGLLKSGKSFHTEFPFKIKDKIGWANDFSSAITDKDSKITGIIAIVTNITERKQIEKELLETKSEAEDNANRFRLIIENTHAGYFFIDNEGLFQNVNKAWLDLYKYDSLDEVIGKHFTKVQQIDDLESAKEFVKGIKNGNPDYMIGDFSRKCKDGSIGYHSFSARPVYSKNEVIGIEGFMIDATKQKSIENELKNEKEITERSEEQFRQLFENMEQGFALHEMIYDENNVSIDYRFILVNKAFEKLTGLKKANIIGKTVKEILPNIEQTWIDNYGKVAKTGIPFQYENYTRELNKYYDVVAYSPKKDYFAVIFSDVTKNIDYQNEIIKAKERAEESEKKFKSYIDNAPDALFVANEQGLYLDANKAACKITGYKKAELLKLKIPDLIHKESLSDAVTHFNKVVQNGEASGISSYVTKSNEKRYWNVDAVKLSDTRFLGFAKDITERVKAQQELIIAKEKAVESDRLKTEFINNMSHEIRTPMNGILGFSDLLNSEVLSPEKRKHYTSIIQNSGDQLLRVIDDILEISKLGTKQVKAIEKEVCLNDLLLEHFSIFDIKAKENKTPLYLKKGLSDINSYILTDDTKLNKILSNLLENALKFTTQGFVEFGYNLKTDSEPVELEIYVRDTGIGIIPGMQEKIFERFSQEEKDLSKNVGGLGLGLSIAKENAELLGGKITLKSEKGKGSTFFVTIPYKPSNLNTENSYSNNNKEKIERDKYTILVVEDEEVNYLYIETLLERKIEIKCITLHAKHGQEAVDICKENTEICLVLMDLKMPIMNGFEATRLIKEFKPDLPIVAQTAYSTKEDREKAFSAGCSDFISKPISKETLNEILNKYLITK